MTSSPIRTSLQLSGLCYFFTWGCSYLCTRPEAIEGRVAIVFDNMREMFATAYENIEEVLKGTNWTIFNDVIIDNAWISIFVVAFLQLSFPALLILTGEKTLDLCFYFVSGCALSWCTRAGIANYLPRLGSAIGGWIRPPTPHYP